MEELVKERLLKSQEGLLVFQEYLKDKTNPVEVRKAVEFAYLFELFAFSTLHALIPDYVPPRDVQIQVAQMLGGTRNYITVEDGKVKVAPEYFEFIKMAQEMKTKGEKNGNLGKS